VIILDSSLLYALLDRTDRVHEAAREWYEETSDALATTPLILAEVDYFVLRRGPAAAKPFYDDLRAGAYSVEWWPTAAAEAAQVAATYAELGLGLADASLVALAARLETTAIATFDERHFRVVRPLRGGEAFTLLPRDAALA
jgi:predicted nucleic acid-binding protein